MLHGTNRFCYCRWPSIQRDSEILRRRIAPEVRLRQLRRSLAAQFERLERRAA